MKLFVRFLIFTALMLSAATQPPAIGRTVIHVGIRPVAPPLCFFDETSNGSKLRGMNIDIMEQAAKLLKADIIYIDTKNLQHRWEMLKNNEINVIAFTGMNESHRKDALYVPTGINVKRRIYVHKACKTVVCYKDLLDKKVGVLEGESHNAYPPMGELVPIASELEGLQKLNQGELDAMIAPSEMIAEYIIQKKKLINVLRVGMVLEEMPLYLAVNPTDSQLHARLSEVMAKLDQRGVMQSIKEKWHGVAFPGSSWSKYGKLILLGLGMAGLALCAVLLWNYQLKRKIRKVTLNLQISESNSRALIESSPDMIFVINYRGKIIKANKEARDHLLGENFDSLDSVQFSDFVVEKDKPKVKEFITKILKEGQTSAEFSFYDKTRRIKELSIAASSITGDHPETVPTACIFARDVTERNRIERELVQADRMAIIGQMAAGVAHEINNPLGIVRANLELIASRGWFAKEAEVFVDAIRRNTERAGIITKDLLAVARPGTSIKTAVNLRELVEMTLAMIKPQMKNITLERQDIGDDPLVYGDRNLLQQVLVNVFLNAQNAMNGCDEPFLKVTCCSNPKDGMARIKVLDNGPGIDKHLLMKIFEPFFTRGKKEGFGLGLFISQRIIERHNGMIFAESEKGKGAQIIIELPLMTIQDQTRIAE